MHMRGRHSGNGCQKPLQKRLRAVGNAFLLNDKIRQLRTVGTPFVPDSSGWDGTPCHFEEGGPQWSGCNIRIRLWPRLLPAAFIAYGPRWSLPVHSVAGGGGGGGGGIPFPFQAVHPATRNDTAADMIDGGPDDASGGVFAQRRHSAGTAPIIANYYVVHPGNTPETHPPTEACMIHFKPASGVQNSGPWDPWQASD